MNSHSWLQNQVTLSPTKGLSILRPKGMGKGGVLVSALMLTSLVDAFSILVIFLLMNTSNSLQEVEIKAMNGLPIASHTDALKKGVILSVDKGIYSIDGKTIPLNRLSQTLSDKKAEMEQGQIIKKTELIIQASRAMDYNDLSPILVAASEASFQNYKLAVIESIR